MLSWLMPVAAFVVQPAGDLFGRPTVPQAVEHEAAQFAVALQPGSGPWRPFREEPTEEITTGSSYHDNLKAILSGRQFDAEDAVSTRLQFHGSPRRESVSRRRDLLQ